MSRADHPSERLHEADAVTRAAQAWARNEELAERATRARIRRDQTIRVVVCLLAFPAAFVLFHAAIEQAAVMWQGIRP